MREEEYINLVKLLRLMAGKAVDLKNNFSLSDDDIQPILDYEVSAENLVTTIYVYNKAEEI